MQKTTNDQTLVEQLEELRAKSISGQLYESACVDLVGPWSARPFQDDPDMVWHGKVLQSLPAHGFVCYRVRLRSECMAKIEDYHKNTLPILWTKYVPAFPKKQRTKRNSLASCCSCVIL